MKSIDKCSHLLLQFYSSTVEPPLKFVHVTTFHLHKKLEIILYF